ncbi:MAG: hypothetical protein Hyperionvirus24_17 [Hyperionvirus sp.]|uniref:Uncharacterized protein n=1 Tax=Hyperionvirus sp. TaxID=2487770 RepID=A0A3G5AAY1_9VIRU|nr:MAG: hypothetical protein Hyperionvirus24_17 [Hyperionvirus sp.]
MVGFESIAPEIDKLFNERKFGEYFALLNDKIQKYIFAGSEIPVEDCKIVDRLWSIIDYCEVCSKRDLNNWKREVGISWKIIVVVMLLCVHIFNPMLVFIGYFLYLNDRYNKLKELKDNIKLYQILKKNLKERNVLNYKCELRVSDVSVELCFEKFMLKKI